MLLIICFLLGIANFAMHKAVIDSDHPFVHDSKLYFGRHIGPYGSYIIEYILLLGTLYFAHNGSIIIPICYLGYTLFNALAAWLLLSGRV